MHDADRAIIDGQEEGFVKIHVRDGTDGILGATIVASRAGEMINEISLAMMPASGCGSGPGHPRLPGAGEAIKMAAVAYVDGLVP